MRATARQENLDLVNIDQVRDDLRRFLQDNPHITQKKVAVMIGITSGAISGFLNGTYTGDNVRVALAVQHMLGMADRRQQAVKAPAFVMTSQAEEVLAIVKYAHVQQDVGVVYGPAGAGKTMTLQHYVEENPGTVFVTADVTISGTKAILEEILDKLGRQEYGDRRRLRKAIVNQLKGSGRLLIIDEAQHLTIKALEAIRSIYDECEIGLVLAGNEQVYTSMLGKKSAPFAQLFSRVGVRRQITGKVDVDDVKKIVCQDIQVSKECLDHLAKVANTPGGIRLMTKMFVLAWTIASDRNEAIAMEHLQSAHNFLMQYPWR